MPQVALLSNGVVCGKFGGGLRKVLGGMGYTGRIVTQATESPTR